MNYMNSMKLTHGLSLGEMRHFVTALAVAIGGCDAGPPRRA